MGKLSKKEIAEYILGVTRDYTTMYTIANKTSKVNKQLWAALHIGFLAGMKLAGYEEEYLIKALEQAQKEFTNPTI